MKEESGREGDEVRGVRDGGGEVTGEGGGVRSCHRVTPSGGVSERGERTQRHSDSKCGESLETT